MAHTPNSLPETGFMRLPAVLAVIPVSKTTWWVGVKSGRYPKAVIRQAHLAES